MKVSVGCPRVVFIGPDTSLCGRQIDVEVEIPPLALVRPADAVELPVQCVDGHRFDAEEIADLRAQINAEVQRLEDQEPTQEFDFPEIPRDVADFLPEDAA